MADVCGVSQRAIYKWMDNGKLPRTEYTGETNYAEKIALASNGLFSADAILTIGRNKTTTKKLMGVVRAANCNSDGSVYPPLGERVTKCHARSH